MPCKNPHRAHECEEHASNTDAEASNVTICITSAQQLRMVGLSCQMPSGQKAKEPHDVTTFRAPESTKARADALLSELLV